MRSELASTGNTRRIQDMIANLEEKLGNPDIVGIGLVYGHPGLGKTYTCYEYFVDARRTDRLRTAWVRASVVWRETSMLKYLLERLGITPGRRIVDLLRDQVIQTLQDQPALIFIDEVQTIANKFNLIALLKEIHDETGCAFVLIGEERTEALLRRYVSFMDRVQNNAVVEVRPPSIEDVAAVVRRRCEVKVDNEVCAAIHRSAMTGKKSVRSVLDRIRQIEAYAADNSLKVVSMREYGDMVGASDRRIRNNVAVLGEVANG